MRLKKLLACILSAGMVISSLSGALSGLALEKGETKTFEAEATMVAVYDNLTFNSPGNYGQSVGQANQLCANAGGLPQISVANPEGSSYAPMYFVFEVEIPAAGLYSMTASYRGHETGRYISFYAGDQTGVGSDPKALDVSGDLLLGQINGRYFTGANANHIETQNVSATGRTGATDPAANTFYLDAGKLYIKALLTGAPSNASGQARLNLDKFSLTLVKTADEPADYTSVDDALAAVPANLEGVYTPDSIAKLNEAMQAVDRGLKVPQQAQVEAMAQAILDAIADLVRLSDMPIVGDVLPFEAEETLTAVYDNLPVGSPLGDQDKGQSQGTPNDLCQNAYGWPQIAVSEGSTASTYLPLYFVFDIQVPVSGYYSMTAYYRGHQTGREVSLYAGGQTGVGEDPKVLDLSGDQLLGKIDASWFGGGANSDHSQEQPVSATGKVGDAANIFYLEAGQTYIKALITGLGAGTSNDATRLNMDRFTLTYLAEEGAKANYTAVDDALAQVPADTSIYTEESVAELDAAVGAVIRDLGYDKQAQVNAMAQAILDAIDQLVLKDAVPTAMQYLATECTDPEHSSKAFATQGYSNAPDFSRFEGMEVGDYAQYTINVPAPGEYLLSIDYRAHESVGKAYFYLNGEKQEKNFDSPGSANTRNTITLGKFNLKAGKNTLKFEMYEKSSNGQSARLNIFYFNIKPYADPPAPVWTQGEPVELWAYEMTDPENSTPDIFQSEFEEYELSRVAATEPGQYASYTIDLPEGFEGEYKVLVQYRAGADCGNAYVSVNGEKVEKLFDCSGMEEQSYYDSLGFHQLKAGENTIRFAINGKDASRTGYNLVLYSFYLVPVDARIDSGYGGFTQRSAAQSTEKVEVYPDYTVDTLSSLYTVKVDGVNLPVITYGQDEYDYGAFSMKSGPVEVEVTFAENISSYEISPKSLGLTGEVNGNKLTFILEKDEYLIIKINGNNRRLILTADPAETDVPPSRGEGVFNITDAAYDADPTGRYIATIAIQRAIDDAAAYGTEENPGIVYVPAGVYQTGSLMLRSNVYLYLEGGATLWGATRPQEWMPKGRKNSIGKGVSYLVYTDNQTSNTKVYGRGTVDGNAKTFKQMSDWRIAVECLAPVNTSHFTTDGITYRGSGIWCVVPAFSNNLQFLNFKIYNNIGYGEDDGIDVNGCQDVVVRNSISVNWDDPYSTKTEHAGGFEINAGWGPEEGKVLENENILFDDCIAWTGCYGFKVGQGIGYDQHDITVQNSTVYDCAVGFGIHHKRFKGTIYNVTFDNITVENITRSNEDHQMWFQCFLQDDNQTAVDGDMIYDVAVQNINVLARSSTSPKLVSRRDGSHITGVTFENIRMYGSTAPASSMGQLGFTQNADNPLLQNSMDKDRTHIHNASNYGVVGLQSSKIPSAYYNNKGNAFPTEPEASAYGGLVTSLKVANSPFYNMVDFGTGVDTIKARYKAEGVAEIELRLDSPDGTLIGTLSNRSAEAGDYIEKSVRVTGAQGVHDLYLVVTAGSVKLDYLDIGRVHQPVVGDTHTLADLWMDGADAIDVTAIAPAGGSVELRAGGADGQVIAEVAFEAADGPVTKRVALDEGLAEYVTLYISAAEGVDVEDISFIPATEPVQQLPYIESADAPADLEVAFGTAVADLELPETVEVTLSDGAEAEVAVEWDTAAYDGDTAGAYTLTGALAAGDGFTNEKGVTVTIRVIVQEKIPDPQVLPGDLDDDGEVTIADVMEACKVMARESAGTDPTDDEIERGDLDDDGEITIADVMEICKILARQG